MPQVDDVEKQLCNGLAYVRRYKNSLRHVNRLPPEILAMAFRELQLDYSYCDNIPGPSRHYECTRVFTVCHYWRTVALGCSELWTCILLSPKTLDIAELFCRRSCQRQLSLVIRNFDESLCPIRMWDLIRCSSKRIRKLVVIDSRILKLSELGNLPSMTTMVSRRSEMGPQRDSEQKKFEWPNLRTACFIPKPVTMRSLKLLPNLTSLRIDLSFVTSLTGGQAAGIRLDTITNVLDTQPLLMELIFDGIPPFVQFDQALVFPRVLTNLKRLAFYRSHSTSVSYIISLIQHVPSLAIAIDLGKDWCHDMDQATVSQFLVNTIPISAHGYICAHVVLGSLQQSMNMLHPVLHTMNILLTGTGAAYKLTVCVTPKTKEKIIVCLGEVGRLESVQTMSITSPESFVIPCAYPWLASLSQLSILSLDWAPQMWAQPKSLVKLFAALPSTLAALVFFINPFTDDDVATSNFDNLVTLNRRRSHPIKIRLSFRVNPTRKQQILRRYTCLNRSNNVDAMSDNDPLVREGGCVVVPPGSDISTTYHPYWPSWLDTRESDRCRLSREAPEEIK